PLMTGVTSLGTTSGDDATLTTGAVLVAAGNTGQPLVSTKTVNGHTSVGLTAYLGDLSTHSGDWARVIVNAGRWLAPLPCAPTAPTPHQHGPTPAAGHGPEHGHRYGDDHPAHPAAANGHTNRHADRHADGHRYADGCPDGYADGHRHADGYADRHATGAAREQ